MTGKAKAGGPPMECATVYAEGHRIGSLAAFGFAVELAWVSAEDQGDERGQALAELGDALANEAGRRYPRLWPDEVRRRNLARFGRLPYRESHRSDVPASNGPRPNTPEEMGGYRGEGGWSGARTREEVEDGGDMAPSSDDQT